MFFVAIPILGGLKKEIEETEDFLFEKYGVLQGYKKIPPHITLCPPFSYDKDPIPLIERVIKDLPTPRGEIISKGHFGKQFIFYETGDKETLSLFYENITHVLKEHGIEIKNAYPFYPHISLAKHLTEEKWGRIYPNMPTPKELLFQIDRISLFLNENGRCTVIKDFPL